MRRHLIEFGKFQVTYDSAGFPVVDTQGQPIKEFVIVKRLYANANDVFGEEKYMAKQQYNSEIVKFTTQYISGLTPDLILRFKNQYYEMVGNPDNVKYLNKELKIEAKRVII